MKKATLLLITAGMLLSVSSVEAEGLFSSCPTTVDLEKGIVVADPARKGVLYKRYRKLEGPLIGMSYINGILTSRRAVEYAGLFTYKYWRNNEIIQYEEPLTDTKELLKFEPDTKHSFESVRFDPRDPSRKWRTSATYSVLKAEDVVLGGCIYSAVRILREGFQTGPNGEAVNDNYNYIFIPELLLKITSPYGDVSEVRNKGVLDDEKWPFAENSINILND